jgi:hypothetical protein
VPRRFRVRNLQVRRSREEKRALLPGVTRHVRREKAAQGRLLASELFGIAQVQEAAPAAHPSVTR